MNAVACSGKVLRWVWTHPANRGRRLRSVARAVRFQARGRLGWPTETIIGRHARMRVWLHDTAAAKALYANPPDWNEMWAWRRILKPGDLFVDVGSNVGTYALWAADAGVEVIAVEPSPTTARKLRENVGLNEFPISVRECALSAEPGTMWLTNERGSMNHLLAAPTPSAWPVEVDTLDNVIGDRYAAGVKIDVEGAERLVLEGARRTLGQRRIGVLQVEWNTMSQHLLGESRVPISAILYDHGYRFRRADECGLLRAVAAPSTSDQDIFAVAPEMA